VCWDLSWRGDFRGWGMAVMSLAKGEYQT